MLLTGLTESGANVLVPGTTAHLQWSCVDGSKGSTAVNLIIRSSTVYKSCFGGKNGNTQCKAGGFNVLADQSLSVCLTQQSFFPRQSSNHIWTFIFRKCIENISYLLNFNIQYLIKLLMCEFDQRPNDHKMFVLVCCIDVLGLKLVVS